MLGPVALIGLGEAYLAMRVGFDAALVKRGQHPGLTRPEAGAA